MRRITVALAFAVAAAAAHSHSSSSNGHHHHHHHLRSLNDNDETEYIRCGTPDLDDAGRTHLQQTLQVAARQRHSQNTDDPIVIPICFHSMYPSFAEALTDDQLQQQLDHLNTAFTADSTCNAANDNWCDGSTDNSVATGISFAVAALDPSTNDVYADERTVSSVHDATACVTRTESDTYGYGDAERSFKGSLRKGSSHATVLNIYFPHTMRDGLLGYARFPWTTIDLGSGNPDTLDGVVVGASYVTGSGHDRFGEGDTLVHEVGHWLGIPHVFEGKCLLSDGISDTAKQNVPHYHCLGNRPPDTCAADAGVDNVHNFMDYSDDRCLYQWTAGQVDVMRAVWYYWRAQQDQDQDTNAAIELTLGEPSEPTQILAGSVGRRFFVEVTGSACCVSCTTRGAPEGDVHLYVKKGGPNALAGPGNYDCRSTNAYSPDEDCLVYLEPSNERSAFFAPALCFGRSRGPTCEGTCAPTTVHVLVEPFADFTGVQDLVVTCQERSD